MIFIGERYIAVCLITLGCSASLGGTGAILHDTKRPIGGGRLALHVDPPEGDWGLFGGTEFQVLSSDTDVNCCDWRVGGAIGAGILPYGSSTRWGAEFTGLAGLSRASANNGSTIASWFAARSAAVVRLGRKREVWESDSLADLNLFLVPDVTFDFLVPINAGSSHPVQFGPALGLSIRGQLGSAAFP